MLVAMISLYLDRAPVSGAAMYVVADETEKTVKLIHPISLESVDVSHADYRNGFMWELWPSPTPGHGYTRDGKEINEIVAAQMLRKAKAAIEMKKQFSAQVVRRAIAGLLGKKMEEIPLLRDTSNPSAPARGFAVRSDKRPGVVDAIAEIFNDGATLDEAVLKLSELFPERQADGMRTTVRCQINRLPAKLGRTLNNQFINPRGKVYQWASSS